MQFSQKMAFFLERFLELEGERRSLKRDGLYGFLSEIHEIKEILVWHPSSPTGVKWGPNETITLVPDEN